MVTRVVTLDSSKEGARDFADFRLSNVKENFELKVKGTIVDRTVIEWRLGFENGRRRGEKRPRATSMDFFFFFLESGYDVREILLRVKRKLVDLVKDK